MLTHLQAPWRCTRTGPAHMPIAGASSWRLHERFTSLLQSGYNRDIDVSVNMGK